MNWLNSFTARERVRNYEKPSGPSMTVPNMTLGLVELVQRYTRGFELPIQKGTYDDSEFGDIEKMDVFDRLELARAMPHYIDGIRDQIRKNIEDTRAAAAPPDPAPAPVES